MRVAIDPQTATTPLLFSARPPRDAPAAPRGARRTPVARVGHLAKLAGLVAVTTVGVALTAAVGRRRRRVFAILNTRLSRAKADEVRRP